MNEEKQTKEYDLNNAEEVKPLPPDMICEGVIIGLKYYEHPSEINEKWGYNSEGQKESDMKAIEIIAETIYDEKTYQIKKAFTFFEKEGKVRIGSKSNLSKFRLKYGIMPHIGQKIKFITNEKGYFEVRL